jgi:hypothetical protein
VQFIQAFRPTRPALGARRSKERYSRAFAQAGEGSRTPDLLFTRQVLYQLSYSGSERFDEPSTEARTAEEEVQT